MFKAMLGLGGVAADFAAMGTVTPAASPALWLLAAGAFAVGVMQNRRHALALVDRIVGDDVRPMADSRPAGVSAPD